MGNVLKDLVIIIIVTVMSFIQEKTVKNATVPRIIARMEARVTMVAVVQLV